MKHTLRCHEFGWARTLRAGAAWFKGKPVSTPRAIIAPALKGLRPQSPLALSLGLPIQEVLAAPRFALSTTVAHNARAFHCVRGSKAMEPGSPDHDNLLRTSSIAGEVSVW